MKFRIDPTEKVVFLSEILKLVRRGLCGVLWNRQGPALRAVLNFVSSYLPQSGRSHLKNTEFAVGYFEYDWGLNEQES